MNTNWKVNMEDMDNMTCDICGDVDDCCYDSCAVKQKYYQISDFAQEKLLKYLIEYAHHVKLMTVEVVMKRKLEEMLNELKHVDKG
jgi:hypothetical protein